MGASLFSFPVFQLLISCGMFPVGKYHDQIPSSVGLPFTSVGGSQLPCMLPPITSANEGPGNIGHVHMASGKSAVPLAVLTAIISPVGVHVEAAQSAKSPGQRRKPSTRPCAIT